MATKNDEQVARNATKAELRAVETAVASDNQSRLDAAHRGRQLRDSLGLKPGQAVPADE